MQYSKKLVALKIAVLLVFVCGVHGRINYIDVFTEKPVFGDQYKMKVIDNFLYEVEVRKIHLQESLAEETIGGNKVAEEYPTEPPKYIETYDVIVAEHLEEDITINSKKDVRDRVAKVFSKAKGEGIITREYLKKIEPKIKAFLLNVFEHFSDFRFYATKDEGFEGNCILFLDVKNLKFYVFKDLLYTEVL